MQKWNIENLLPVDTSSHDWDINSVLVFSDLRKIIVKVFELLQVLLYQKKFQIGIFTFFHYSAKYDLEHLVHL